ncbi:hypothetical protein C7T96_23385 [Nitratireductor sp. StC3]|nr:hypothetical protein C7T96_23385 [Nitratireductor sp. StC3]
MPRTRNPYRAEFREQIIALARAGRSVESLARELEPCVATIHGWVKQAGIDGGIRDDGLTNAERDELRRLRNENHQLRTERPNETGVRKPLTVHQTGGTPTPSGFRPCAYVTGSRPLRGPAAQAIFRAARAAMPSWLRQDPWIAHRERRVLEDRRPSSRAGRQAPLSCGFALRRSLPRRETVPSRD